MAIITRRRGLAAAFSVPVTATPHPELDVTLETDGGPVLLLFSGAYLQSGGTVAAAYRFVFDQDGVELAASEKTLNPGLNANVVHTICYLLDVSADRHRWRWIHSTTAGNGVIQANSDIPIFIVVALPRWQRSVG